jgi:septal ring factor EnvC (AmiA/AmiB activator)
MKKFVSLGTECVELLKAARASQGKFFCYVVSSTCLICLSLVLYSAFFPLFRVADALSAANARISSLEAELEASRKVWDVVTAAKATAENSTKSATAKAKKAEKALADADRARAQREQAITNRLNQILALAGGKCRAFLFSADLLILLLIGVCSLIFCFCLFVSIKNAGILMVRC